MNVSLDQAIEMHAKALRHRRGRHAPRVAHEKAEHCAARGDHEGHTVWMRVAARAKARRSRAVARDRASGAADPTQRRLPHRLAQFDGYSLIWFGSAQEISDLAAYGAASLKSELLYRCSRPAKRFSSNRTERRRLSPLQFEPSPSTARSVPGS